MKHIHSKYFRIILISACTFCFFHVIAQQDFYEHHLKKGKSYYYNTPPNYVNALKEFDLAKNYISPNDQLRIDTINSWNNKTRDAIVRLYQTSENEKLKAQREKQKADTATIQAELARTVAEQALNKTTKIINAFYFYEDQFALAYKNNKYGFINKNGDVVINYKYEDARPFDYTGLAMVKRNNQTYILDNKKNEYLLANGPNKLSDSTQALDLSNQADFKFPANIDAIKNLRVLLINGNEIREMPSSITQLHQLRKLFIYNNNLSELPNSIGSLSKLITLDASINRIVELPDSIGQLINLEELVLYDNNLMDLPPEIGNLHKLFFLDVGNNILSGLPNEFDSLSSLRILALGENQLDEFPPQISSLENLLMLDLSDNYIDSVPAWIKNYKTLTHLHLWNNNIEVLPKEITKLDSLKVLIAGDNKLSSLPLKMDSLTKLEELNLYGNQLNYLPAELGKMKELRKLDLRKNTELDLPQNLAVFSSSNKQIIISASGNELDYLVGKQNLQIKFDEFESLPVEVTQIKNLLLLDLINCPDISANDIQSAFKKYPKKIEYSSSTSPQIADTNALLINVDMILFLKLDQTQAQKLTTLDLSNRKLQTIPVEVLSLNNLNSLNLGGNNLSVIPVEINNLKNLKTLNLLGNPLQEDEIEKAKIALPNCEIYYDSISL